MILETCLVGLKTAADLVTFTEEILKGTLIQI